MSDEDTLTGDLSQNLDCAIVPLEDTATQRPTASVTWQIRESILFLSSARTTSCEGMILAANVSLVILA